jgi:hypothetical protein
VGNLLPTLLPTFITHLKKSTDEVKIQLEWNVQKTNGTYKRQNEKTIICRLNPEFLVGAVVELPHQYENPNPEP